MRSVVDNRLPDNLLRLRLVPAALDVDHMAGQEQGLSIAEGEEERMIDHQREGAAKEVGKGSHWRKRQLIKECSNLTGTRWTHLPKVRSASPPASFSSSSAVCGTAVKCGTELAKNELKALCSFASELKSLPRPNLNHRERVRRVSSCLHIHSPAPGCAAARCAPAG